MNETIDFLCKEAAYHANQYQEKIAAIKVLTQAVKEAETAREAETIKEAETVKEAETINKYQNDYTQKTAGFDYNAYVNAAANRLIEKTLESNTTKVAGLDNVISPEMVAKLKAILGQGADMVKQHPLAAAGLGAAAIGAPMAANALMGGNSPEEEPQIDPAQLQALQQQMMMQQAMQQAAAMPKQGSYYDPNQLSAEKIAAYREALLNMA